MGLLFLFMIPLKFTTKSIFLALGCFLVLLGFVALLFLVGNQQGLQESVIALRAIQPTDGFIGNVVFASVLDAPFFGWLLSLLQAVHWGAQVLWLVWLVAGFFSIGAIGNAILSSFSERKLFLGLILFGSFYGYWQLSAINFQTYATVGMLLFCLLLMLWFKGKTAPIKGDTLPPWKPVRFDIVLGAAFAVMAFELGWAMSLILLAITLFRHQQVSTVLPATWQARSIATLRWVWIGLLVGLIGETMLLYLLGEWQGWLPLLRVPPTLPEWTGWQTSLSSSGFRLLSLAAAFFPWNLWLLSALKDLWFNVQKGGAKVSLFLESERQPLRLLSLAGMVLGAVWVVFPAFWLGWSFFLLSHAFILTDWLTATCTLTITDSSRFKRGFLWISLFLLALGLLGLVWQNHSASFQLSQFPLKLQLVLTVHSLWCVLGGCLGLLLLWRGLVQPKPCSIGLVGWFAGWMLIQTLGVVPLLAWEGGNRTDIEATLEPRIAGNSSGGQFVVQKVGVCLDAVALRQGVFLKLLGAIATESAYYSRGSQLAFIPLSSATCLTPNPMQYATNANGSWLLMSESAYYENKATMPAWQHPLMGMTFRFYHPAGAFVSPTLLQPLLLPFMVPQQETWVLIPVQ
jgi:hypothetical protein